MIYALKNPVATLVVKFFKIFEYIIMYSNLLVVCDIPDANLFMTSVNENTLPLLYSKGALLDVLADNTFERIGIAFEKKELFDVDFRLFNVKHIDFLACDTLNDPMWRNYYKTLQDAGITVGASDNKTGNLKYGGDWVMESTSEDIEKVYFSTEIEYYKYLLLSKYSYMIVVKSDGLYSSGDNRFGQLGNGYTTFINSLTYILNGVTAVSCGDNHTIILVDGKVYSCGWNRSGQLGYTANNGTNTILTDMGVTGATSVSCGGLHTAVLIGGKVYSCGWNYYGQLGYTANNGTTLKDMGITGATAVSCGDNHTIILIGDKVYSCGYNYYGQLGYTENNNANPTLTGMGVTGVTAVSCGLYHTIILIGGKVYSCGLNNYGQLGYTANGETPNPKLTDMGVTGATAVSCGSFHTAILVGDRVYSCGYNNYGQLGYTANSGTNTPNPTLTDMGVTGATSVSCGYSNTAVLIGDKVYSCGNNIYGQLGYTANSGTDNPNPTLTDMGITGATIVSCGGNHTAVLVGDKVYSCGYNNYGQLGINIFYQQRMNINEATTVSCGGVHTVAIKDGILYGCGQNTNGQLGSAVPIGEQTGTLTPMGLTGVTAVSCGTYHTVAIKDGILYGCGYGGDGQLGSAGTTGTLTPMGLTGVTEVSAGWLHTIAISNGILYGCGLSDYDQLGSAVPIGGTTGTLTPMGLTECTAVSCGYYHTVAISNGILYGCGDGGWGKLGSAGTTGTLTPMGLTGCTAVSCGVDYTVAISNGILYGCGYGGFGQLGSAVSTGTLTPMGLTGCTAVSCGVDYMVAISNGILYGAGSNISTLLKNTGETPINNFEIIDSNVLNINDSGKLTTYLQFIPPSINSPTNLSATSNSMGTITYTSSNPLILSVTGTTATPITSGLATIIASQEAYGNYFSRSVTGSVQIYVTNLGFTLPSFINQEITLAVTSDSTGSITYSSSNSSVLSVTGTKATPVGSGNVIITASQEANGNYFSRSVTGSVDVYFNNLGFTLPSFINQEITLAVTSDSTGSITYSSNLAVLSVTGSGKSFIVTPLQTGTGTITVRQDATGKFLGKTITGSVDVYFNNLSFTPPAIINKKITLAVTSDSTGSISYSSNSSDLTINGTKATPVSSGNIIITATQTANEKFLGRSVSCSVDVYFNNLSFTPPAIINKKTRLFATSDSTGSITFTCNPQLLRITGNTITPIKSGTTIITATQSANGNYSSATYNVEVYVTRRSEVYVTSFKDKYRVKQCPCESILNVKCKVKSFKDDFRFKEPCCTPCC